jgi:hypothetical protein
MLRRVNLPAPEARLQRKRGEIRALLAARPATTFGFALMVVDAL